MRYKSWQAIFLPLLSIYLELNDRRGSFKGFMRDRLAQCHGESAAELAEYQLQSATNNTHETLTHTHTSTSLSDSESF